MSYNKIQTMLNDIRNVENFRLNIKSILEQFYLIQDLYRKESINYQDVWRLLVPLSKISKLSLKCYNDFLVLGMQEKCIFNSLLFFSCDILESATKICDEYKGNEYFFNEVFKDSKILKSLYNLLEKKIILDGLLKQIEEAFKYIKV